MQTTRIESVEDSMVVGAERATPAARTRQTMTAYLDALLGGGDIGRYLAEDATFTVVGSDQVTQGRDAVVGTIDWLHHQAFTAQPVVKTTLYGDDYAAIETDFVGTHVGEFTGVAPTNRHVQVPYSVFYDLDGDAITALRVYMPMDALMRQLGVA